MSEQDWGTGNRAAWLSLLYKACSELGYVDPGADKARWLLERESAIATLRSVCARHGDNEWDETLVLSDIIDKHLARHLPEK